MHHFGIGYGMGWGPLFPLFGFGLLLLLVWSLLWKGLALWRASKRGDKIWFVVCLLLNTAGILEIIYIFFVTGGKLSEFTDPITHHPPHHTS